MSEEIYVQPRYCVGQTVGSGVIKNIAWFQGANPVTGKLVWAFWYAVEWEPGQLVWPIAEGEITAMLDKEETQAEEDRTHALDRRPGAHV